MVNGTTAHIVAMGLVLVALLCLVGGVGLTWTGHPMPESLVALGSAAVGALSTLMVSKAP